MSETLHPFLSFFPPHQIKFHSILLYTCEPLRKSLKYICKLSKFVSYGVHFPLKNYTVAIFMIIILGSQLQLSCKKLLPFKGRVQWV